MTTMTNPDLTATRAHVHALEATDGRVALSIDHPDTMDRESARVLYGDDAAACADLSRAEAVDLAFALLRAANVDPLDLATRLLDARSRVSRSY